MRKIYIAICLLVISFASNAQTSGIFESYAILSLNGGANAYYDLSAATGNPDFQGAALGTFIKGTNTLVFKGGQNKTFKNGGCNIANSSIWYRVFLSSGTGGAFTGINEPFAFNIGGAGDQQWEQTADPLATDIIVTLAPGKYTIQAYVSADYNSCGGGTHFVNNGGANYSATFTVCGSPTAALAAGNYPIPGCFPNIAAAVTHLNTYGITNTGAVQFDVAAGFTEPALPANTGITLTATGVAGSPIIFKKDGAGANPLITAPTWTAGGTTDGIFKIVGGDFITLDGLTIQENSANTVVLVGATNTMTEVGIGLFLSAATNGAQNNTIQNCTITLNSAYNNSVGIFSTSSSSTTNTVLAASASTGTNSNNKAYGNTISNVAYGFYAICEPITAAINESGWDIGGAAVGTGNTITFGASTSTLVYTRFSGTAEAGIVFRNGAGVNVRYNTITSNSLAYPQSSFGAILVSSGTAPTGITYTSTISNNNVTLTNIGTTSITGIDFGHGIATGTIIGSNNTIVINQNVAAASAGALTGIRASYTHGGTTLNSNSVTFNQNTSAGALTSAVTGITAAGTSAVAITSNINSNTVTIKQNVPTGTGSYGAGVITYLSVAGTQGIVNVNSNQLLTTGSTIRSTGTLFGLNNESTIQNLTVNANTITIDRIAALGSVFGTFSTNTPSSLAQAFTNNIITFTNLAGTTAPSGISNLDGTTAAVKSFTGNTISITGTHTGTSIGLTYNYSATGAPINNNSITISCASPTVTGLSTLGSTTAPIINLNTLSLSSSSTSPTSMQGIVVGSAGASTVSNTTFTKMEFTGIFTTGGTSSGIVISAGSANVFNNIVKTISAGAATSTGSPIIDGILVSGGTTNVYQNKVYGLSTLSTGATTAVNGIRISGGTTTVNVYNNTIGGLSASVSASPDAVRGIAITGVPITTTHNIFHNSIYLDATSTGANFGTSGIFHTTSATATTSALNLRNNIIINKSVAAGTGFNVAYRRSTTALTNFAPTSNNNIFYAGTPSAANLIFYDGTNSDQTIANYITRMATRDANSYTENTAFISTAGANANFLRIANGTATLAESGAVLITTPNINFDYWNVTRPIAAPTNGGSTTKPDIGASETDAVSPAPVITLTSVSPTLTPALCTKANRLVTVSITTTAGTISGAVINYSHNGTAQAAITMVNTSGNIWTGTMLAPTVGNAVVTWSVVATSSISLTTTLTGTSYSDEPTFGVTATATATPSTICSGSATSLNVAISQSGTATIGTGTTLTSATTQPTAFCNRWLGHRSQVIFTATELIAAGLTAGNISSMAYNITTLGDAATNANFTVRIGGTLLTNFTAATFEPITGFTTCFPAATYTHTGTGWQTISFSTPYNWNGTSNIIVDVSMDGANATNNSQTYFTATPGNSVLYTTTSVSATVTLSTTRLNVRFAGNTTLTPTAYSWSDGSTVVGTTNPLNQSPAVNTSYTATATVSGCPIVSNAVAVTVNPLPTAPTGTNSSQCGTAIPTASVADLNGFGATRLFKWYDAAIGGTLLQSNISATYLSNVGPSTTIFYVTVTNPITGCESARTPVTISIVAAPTLTITGNQVACNNQIYSMSVTPILPAVLSDYDSYKWSPITNLYTDAAATIAYTTGTSATTVYVKGTVAAATTYTCTSSNSISLCSNTATSTVAIQPVVTGYTVPTSTYCLSGTPTLTAIPATGYAASTLQWQSSTTALVGPYTDISGATNASYTPAAALNATIYYQLLVKDGTGAVCGTAPQTTITLNSPMATSLGDKTICGSGTVNLAVTAGGGANINWFAAATGGGIIGTGAIFTTPTINTTTSYYAQAELVSTGNATIGTATTTTGSISYPSAFANYDYQTWTQLVYTAAELQAAGLRAGNITSLSLNIAAKSNANPSGYSISLGTVGTSTLSAFTTTGLTQVFTSPSMATVVGLNNIPFSAVYNWDGISNILVDIRGTGAFGSSNATTYYTTQTNSVVYNYTGTSNATYWTSNPTPLVSSNRFNIIFAGQAATCVSSPRTQVQAIVTPAPAITAPANVSICAGSPTNLTVTSGNANYTYAWSPATGLSATTGATVTATPTTTQTYTITATDNISAPPVCVAISTVTVTVNPIPAGVTATAAPNPICAGSTINLTSTVTNPTTILTEGFETPPATWNNWSTSTFAPSNVWNVNTAATGTAHTGAGMAQYLYNSTNAANTYFMSPSQSLTAGLTYTISYWYRASSASFAENMKLTWGTTDNAGTHTNTLADHPSFVNTTWVQNTVTFVPAISGVYYFGWHAYSVANRFNIYLDDITITRNDNFSYAWTTTPAGFTSTVQNPTGVIPNNGDVYNVKVTNTSTTCFATASTAAVVVNPVPAEPIDGTTAAQCGAVTYTVTSAEATPTYKWYTAATGGVPVATNITGIYSPLVYNSPGSNVIYVSVSSAFCESPRKAITVTSSPSDPLTITAAQVACNNAYAEILITTPTSGAGSFASYVWSSPTAGVLFSDNAGTAYIAGTSVTSVFVRSATAGSITVNVVAVNGACSANTSTTVFVQPATATLNAPATTFCQTGSTTISASPAIGYAAGSLQWQSSTTGVAGSYTDIAGETGVTYTTPTLNNTIYYQLLVKNTAGISCVTPQITIIVNNPLITATTLGTRCGTGTVLLGATASTGTINWFAAASGGTSLGTGTSFTTLSITGTTTYYASASVGLPVNAVIGTGTALTSATGEITAFCNRRDSYWSQTVYTGAELSAAGLLAGNISSITYNIASIGDAATNANYTIKIGTSATTTLSAFTTVGLTDVYGPVTQTHAVGNNLINFSTPYVWDGVSNIIVDLRHEGIDAFNNAQTYITPTVGNTTVYAFSSSITSVAALVASNPAPTTSVNRLNTIFGQLGCESARTAVVATVTPPLALTIDKTTDAVCTGSSSVVTVNSTLANYDSYTWSGPAGTFVSSGTPAGALVTLTPTVNPTVYTLTANNSVTGCNNTATVTVTVNPIPSIPTNAIDYTLCQNTTIPGGAGLAVTTEQAVTSFTGSLVVGPTFVRGQESTTTYTASGVGTAVYFTTHTFKVSTTGSYTFNECSPVADGFAFIYQNSFNPASPATNFLIGNDDGNDATCLNSARLVRTLTAGTTYVLVTTSFNNGETGAYTWTFSGPGSILLPGGSAVWYTAATGGTSIGTGAIFNPIGVAGSGVPNSATAGSTTFYAAATSGLCESVRVPVVLTINPQPTATIAYTGTPYCAGGTATVTALGIGNTGGTYTFTPTGLVINGSTGDIDLTASTPGAYTITYTKAAVGVCAIYTTNTSVTIKATGTWLGVNTDWNNPANWCGGIPTSATNVIIPVVASGFYPIIDASAPLPYANNVSIAAAVGANIPIITVGTGATFNLNGTLSGAGLMDVVAGTINTTGTATTINGANLTSNTANTIKLSGNATIATGAIPVRVTNQIDFVTSGSTLTTNDNLVLVSTATGTANIGNVNGGSVVGKAEIQRFLPSVAQKSWRLLATPVVIATSPTITNSWREGGLDLLSTGFGTRVTGADGPFLTYAGVTGEFLDEYTVKSNMKSYSMTGDNFTDITGTDIVNSRKIANEDGYFLFVRGDRAVGVSIGGSAGSTTLRIKGDIRTGDQTFVVNAAPSAAIPTFRSVGNPFPSRIDMRTVNFNGISGSYYAWTPNRVGSFNVGSYILYENDFIISGGLVGSNNFNIVPAAFASATIPGQRNFIESGEAFFVQNGSTTVAGSLVIKEGDKATGSALIYASRTGVTTPTLEINLLSLDATGNNVVVDGAKINFNNSFDNLVDNKDIVKITNTLDNLGIKTAGKNLIVERRKIPQEIDTIQLNISALRTANFTIEIDPSVLSNAGVTAELKDRFLQTTTLVSMTDVTSYSFATTADANSKAANRFYIVFKPSGTLPVTFVDIAATKNTDNTNTVKWTIANEQNVQNYQIERSDRGTNFVGIGTQVAIQTSNYNFVDATPLIADNYYRIKAISVNGQIQYSPIVKIAANNKEKAIQIVVNPIMDNKVQLSFVNKAGKYNIALFNSLGQLAYTTSVNVASSNELKVLDISSKLVAGVYQLVVTNSNGEKTVLQALVK